jgi:predicted DNA-binding transcriptional regulator AlpA
MKDTLILSNEVYDDSGVVLNTLGITKITLSRWVKAQRLPKPLKLGNKLYFNRKEVESYLLSSKS